MKCIQREFGAAYEAHAFITTRFLPRFFQSPLESCPCMKITAITTHQAIAPHCLTTKSRIQFVA